MSTIYAILDLIPGEAKIIGTDIHENIIESDKPVLIYEPFFTNEGVAGQIVEEKIKLTGLKPVVRNEEGEFMSFDGRHFLLTAAYALINPRLGIIKYTNNRP